MQWIKILTSCGSLISIGFGVWHFFVPRIWNWYSYMDKEATELVLAVRATNLFFSLSLVLFGVANLFLTYKTPQDRYSLLVMLSISAILWGTRVVLQLIYPQGSNNLVLQYGMLLTFILVFVCFALALFILWNKMIPAQR